MTSPELDSFRQLYPMTDPGPYAALYDRLPQSVPELCALIREQFIHPGKLDSYRDELTEARGPEDGTFISVEQILAGLVDRNPNGLIMERRPDERLIVSCRHHALLLTSILRYRDIPARVRVGFAQYVAEKPDKHVDHWVCEVWDDAQQRWQFADADTQRVDFPRDEFELAGDVWLNARAQRLQPEQYGALEWWGMPYIRSNLCHDFDSILGNEPIYWEGPRVFHHPLEEMQPEQYLLLDQVAELLKNPEHNIDQLRALRADQPDLQWAS